MSSIHSKRSIREYDFYVFADGVICDFLFFLINSYVIGSDKHWF